MAVRAVAVAPERAKYRMFGGGEGRPGRSYLNTIREAARQRGLPADYMAFLDSVEARE